MTLAKRLVLGSVLILVLTVGILLSAFVMALFLVPGLTALIGHTAWWPGHGDEAGAAAAEPQEPAEVVG